MVPVPVTGINSRVCKVTLLEVQCRTGEHFLLTSRVRIPALHIGYTPSVVVTEKPTIFNVVAIDRLA